jgi:uncharacterized protein (UPF0371 family)
LQDFNLIDPFHEKAYNEIAINYNRDVEAFPTLLEMIRRVVNKDNFVHTYQSPTDMGVNMIKEGIINDLVCRESAKQEIIRRWFDYREKFYKGQDEIKTLETMDALLQRLELKPTDRKVVEEAQKTIRTPSDYSINYAAALELGRGEIITGRNSGLLRAESSVLLNSMKYLAGIPDDIHILPELFITNVQEMNNKYLKREKDGLSVPEVLTILASSKILNPPAAQCLEQLTKLKGSQMHTTRMTSPDDKSALHQLGIYLTSDVHLPTDEK